MRITTLVEKGFSTPQTFEWEGEGYDDEPYGEAVAVLLSDNRHMAKNWKVVVYSETGEILTHQRAVEDAGK